MNNGDLNNGDFRINKNGYYTTISNYHLRDKTLSLKAKGLLSMLMAMPDELKMSVRGLAEACKEGPDSIQATLAELEGCGYLKRERTRNPDGTLGRTAYSVFEKPVQDEERQQGMPRPEKPYMDEPDREKPRLENPDMENPDKGKPRLEKPYVEQPHEAMPSGTGARPAAPARDRRSGKDRNDINNINYYTRDNHSSPVTPIPSYADVLSSRVDGKKLAEEFGKDAEKAIKIAADMCGRVKPLRIGGKDISPDDAREKLMSLGYDDMRGVLRRIGDYQGSVKNPERFIMTSLWNAACQPNIGGRPIGQAEKHKNAFHNFQQRNIDYDKLLEDEIGLKRKKKRDEQVAI